MSLRGLHLHLEPHSGIAGDMAVAALVDAGVPASVVRTAVRAMGVKGLETRFERRRRGAYVGRGFVVRWPGKGGRGAHDHVHGHGHGHEHRDYAQIRRLLARARLDAPTRALASRIFARIAEVEGALHGTPVDQVAFHEVGAYDSIADVVGAAAALSWLGPVSVSSEVPVVGTGQVRTAHGLVPVPAPATAALLRGLPMRAEGSGELTTPTGAAILASVVQAWGPPPPLRVKAVGYGAGTRELRDRPNVLRVLLGEPLGVPDRATPDDVLILEANLDDMSPQLVAPLLEALTRAGALDAWSTPILMKKGRPALLVSALAPPEIRGAVEDAFFRNSTTLGVRVHPVGRTVLSRSIVKVRTAHGEVRVKVAALGREVLGATPEFEDCRRLAAAAGVPVRLVLAEAAAAALGVARARTVRRKRRRR